jgi:hypothetical protein
MRITLATRATAGPWFATGDAAHHQERRAWGIWNHIFGAGGFRIHRQTAAEHQDV